MNNKELGSKTKTKTKNSVGRSRRQRTAEWLVPKFATGEEVGGGKKGLSAQSKHC